jgi:hypothetical protein
VIDNFTASVFKFNRKGTMTQQEQVIVRRVLARCLDGGGMAEADRIRRRLVNHLSHVETLANRVLRSMEGRTWRLEHSNIEAIRRRTENMKRLVKKAMV